MNDTITVNGLTFAVTRESDAHHGAPWDEEDGHGPVREVRANYTGYMQKRPGERVLNYEFARRGHAYDVQEAMRIAKRDGWGVSDKTRLAFRLEHDRDMTPGEVAAMAVWEDSERMRRWLTDQWCYIGVVVELLDVDGDPTGEVESLWGVESDSDDYCDDVARELAQEIARRIGRKKHHTRGPCRIRVRA